MSKSSQFTRRLTFKGLIFTVVYAVFIQLLLGVIGLNLWQKRIFLEEQLASHAQDSATSLGLSLTSVTDGKDWVAASSMIDAIFDSGAYLSIRLLDSAGQPTVDRRATADLEGVPDWFESLIPLETPLGQAEVMAGWQPVATIEVRSHAGFAYRELWRSVKWQGLLFLILGLVTFVLLHFLLSQLLRPIKRLQRAAQRIESRDFEVELPLPVTAEMRTVTASVNSMTATLRATFADQLQTIESLRRQALLDPVTNLMNRDAFDKRCQAVLLTEDKARGVVALLELKYFQRFNEKHGRQKGDALLLNVAEILQDQAQAALGSFVGRHSGAGFSMYLSGFDQEQAEGFFEALNLRLQSLVEISSGKSQRLAAGGETEVADISGHHCLAFTGAVVSRPGDRLTDLLAAADFALREALQEGVHAYAFFEGEHLESDEIRNASEWQVLLRDAFEQGRFQCHYQPVAASETHRVMLQQLLVRLEQEGSVIKAADFVPMIERHGMAQELDKFVLSQALTRLADHPEDTPLGVMLSTATLGSSQLEELLRGCFALAPGEVSKLYLECPEYALQACWAGFDRLLQLRNEFGFRIVVSHFGTAGFPFSYLKDARIDAIKIDPGLVPNIDNDSGHQFYLRSIVQIARAQNIHVIAMGVERQAEWDCLMELGVDGAMGYFICHPQPEPVHLES